MSKWRAVSATAIMMDPYTGEILALPTGQTSILAELFEANQSEIRNRAITDCYERVLPLNSSRYRCS